MRVMECERSQGLPVALALEEFDFLRKLMFELSSIIIEPGKEYLAECRLGSLAHEQGFPSVQGLLASMRQSVSSAQSQRVLDAMTNNETWFFRDMVPFQALREKLLPALLPLRARQKKLSIWSAASSTGQEAYSIAMLLDEHFAALPEWKVDILGTDISTAAVQRARQGRYTQMEISRGVSPQQLKRYFRRDGTEWKIADAIRERANFRVLNLFGSWQDIESCDIIFLRNVLIYFDVDKKREILTRIRTKLKPDGFLLLGSAETTLTLDDAFVRFPYGAISYYQLKGL